ncbi:MAG: SAM-dependent methyltransferase [Steroidobacteraceae bacterium]
MGPLLTLPVLHTLRAAAAAGMASAECSLDLQRSSLRVALDADGFFHAGIRYPLPARVRDRTIYHWHDGEFIPTQRFSGALIKLVPTDWGPPTFEIDGIKMLPTAKVSPWTDAEVKVALIEPRGKVILDCCGGLGYFAAWCIEGRARQIVSFEKNPDVIWLRGLNPWSPPANAPLSLELADVSKHIATLATSSVDAILHDPPRFGIAGELYSLAFYEQLARVIRRKGRLFHYTGSPNRLTSNRDVPKEVAKRLKQCGFTTTVTRDGLLATKT